MQDALTELINDKIDKRMINSDYTLSVPAKVKEPLSNGMYVTEILANNAQMILPNYSGTELDVNENVQVFYKGNTLSERTAYIGAAIYKPEGANRNKIKYIPAMTSTGTVGELTPTLIAKIDFEAVMTGKVFVSFNANVIGTALGEVDIFVYFDEVLHEYQPQLSVNTGFKYVESFQLPFNANTGNHTVEVKAFGVGNYTDICCYVWGQGLRDDADAFEPTNENDYIYIGGKIIYYIGTKLRPEIPTTLEGVPVTELAETAFNGTNVVAVKIPEGVTTIR